MHLVAAILDKDEGQLHQLKEQLPMDVTLSFYAVQKNKNVLNQAREIKSMNPDLVIITGRQIVSTGLPPLLDVLRGAFLGPTAIE